MQENEPAVPSRPLKADGTGAPDDAPPPVTTRQIDWNGASFTLKGDPADPYFKAVTGPDPIFAQALERVPPGGVVLDIGANIGVTTLAASSRVRQVHAFEPDAKAASWLWANIEANGARNVDVHPLAVGEVAGPHHFYSNAVSQSASHLVTDATLAHAKARQVDMTTLDTFMSQRDLERVDLVKIDIEGFEIDALRGATDMLARYRPDVLVEFNFYTMIAFRNLNPREMLDFLRATFPLVERVRAKDGVPRFERITSDAHALRFLHDNLLKAGCVDDLLCSFRD